jgi:hypothetical protein
MLTTLFSDRRPHAGEEQLRRALDQSGATRHLGHDPFGGAIVHGKDVVLGGLNEPEALKLGQHVRHVGREVVSLAEVAAAVIQLPDVGIEGW